MRRRGNGCSIGFSRSGPQTPGQRSSPVTSMPIDPQLPQELERLDMRIRYREHSLDLRLTRAALTVRGRERGAGRSGWASRTKCTSSLAAARVFSSSAEQRRTSQGFGSAPPINGALSTCLRPYHTLDQYGILTSYTTMTRWGDHSWKNRALLAESQQLYNGGPSPYAVEYLRKYCCTACKQEIHPMQGWYWQASTGRRWHVHCYETDQQKRGNNKSPRAV